MNALLCVVPTDPPPPPAPDHDPRRTEEVLADQTYRELRLRDGTAVYVPRTDAAGAPPRD